LRKSDFAMVTSGTATLETALAEVPMVIVYRGSFITNLAFHLFVKIPFIGLVNIIAGKEIAPELLQKDATADKLYCTVYEIMEDKNKLEKIRAELRSVKRVLGEKGASRRAAEKVSQFIAGL